MMVTFISQCEKRALKRTRRVLDAFANRIGDNTWQTVITEEGLLTVKKLLRKTATRQTAVSCHWIRSRSRSQLLWIVGSREQFNEEGIVPVNRTAKAIDNQEDFFSNTFVIALLAQLAGLFHDVGKATTLFQQKLLPNVDGKRHEPYRHEWVSLRVFQAFVGSNSDKEWLTQLVNVDNRTEADVLDRLGALQDGLIDNVGSPFDGLPPVAKLVAWLIVSHHKLPQYPKVGEMPPTLEKVDQWLTKVFDASWNSPQCLTMDYTPANWTFSCGTPFKSAHWQTHASIVAKAMLKEQRIFERDWFDQRFTAHLSRLALMLADHYYSSQKETTPEWQDRNYPIYANTDTDEHGQKYLKQQLDEHNIAVGHHAYHIAKELPKLRNDLPALSLNRELSKKIPDKLAQIKRNFGWQDKAYELANAVKEETKKYGFFGISMASTGKGKTRANAKIMYGLADEDNCRFTVALGLRTLTLQTGDALEKELKLKKDEFAVLIGSQAVKELHQQLREPNITLEESLGSSSAASLLEDEVALKESLPNYDGVLAKWLNHDPRILKLIQAPVLVSTIDYLMPATEGIRGGRQIAPMLRLLTSDLVLDEPDDFGLADFPALCRLVNWAGMLGSRVLLSTATIPPELASALYLAYQAGRKHYTQVNGELRETAAICCAWFDEFNKPVSQMISDITEYQKTHDHFVEHRTHTLLAETKPLHQSTFIELKKESSVKPSQVMADKIRQSIVTLHQQHALIIENKKVSIGVVRMANISPLVAIAKQLLAQPAPDNYRIHYCIYHSQFPLLQRSKIEKQLDHALKRHDQQVWLNQSGLHALMEKERETNHIFVVLATAVVEVGRDHDYDWAIVEPSSMRSIIQLAGRVQRHRQQIPQSENIHILSKNYKGLKGQSPCFENPGFEKTPFLYAHSDLNQLSCQTELAKITAIPRIKRLIERPQFEQSTQADDKPKFIVFNELEHFSQAIRLMGSRSEHNCASLWWNNEATWCAEIQRIQPFRDSKPTAEYRLDINRNGNVIWKKRDEKSFPVTFSNTDDIARQSENVTIAHGNVIWSHFNLAQEVQWLSQQLNASEELVRERFLHLSLRKLNTDNNEQWQYHPVLGVYENLKKDKYGDE